MNRDRTLFTRVISAYLSAAFVLVSTFGLVYRAAAAEEGVALAIIYDTSGSMSERVPAGPGKSAPKYVIANQALNKIVERISRFASNAPAGAPRKIEVGLYVFRGEGAAEAIRLGPFDPEAIRKWVQSFSRPDGATPLGRAVALANKAVLASNLSRKHIVIITDGQNTAGPTPEAVMAKAAGKGGNVSFHFVAFDVDAKVFAPVKALGATVLGAADEAQLNTQLAFILEKQILLEDEEPARPAAGKSK